MVQPYEVALSFAGEDRQYAKELADALSARHIRIFFDELEADRLWGEDLRSHLSEIYSRRARYVVMLISRFYPEKAWTTVERIAAEQAAIKQPGYILPVRLDDVDITRVLTDTAYVGWSGLGASRIADLLLNKLGRRLNEVDGAELIRVPEGEFIMGADGGPIDRTPQHNVWLDTFYIYKYPVTYAQYTTFCESTNRPFSLRSKMEDLQPEADHPIVAVSWRNASDYCTWANASLPTEAQWEKAARGTDGRRFPWGNQWEVGRCRSDRLRFGYAGKAYLVGRFPDGASPYGVQDMRGNIWEWCSDWYDEVYYSASPCRNPIGPSVGTERVKRGCGWSDDFEWFPANFECSFRYHREPGFQYRLDGFRCVINLRAGSVLEDQS